MINHPEKKTEKNFSRLAKLEAADVEHPTWCNNLTTWTNHTPTWPKMIPEASPKLTYQSAESFKCHSLLQRRRHSKPLNGIHDVALSKLSKVWRLPTTCALDSDTHKNVTLSELECSREMRGGLAQFGESNLESRRHKSSPTSWRTAPGWKFMIIMTRWDEPTSFNDNKLFSSGTSFH